MKAEFSKSRSVLFYLGLCSPGIIPLLVPYLPFQDWPGHLGVVGVMLHFDEPVANLAQFYGYEGAWKPNTLLYWMIYGFAKVFGPLWGARLVLALSLAGLGPAMAYFCRKAEADQSLAYFALPLAIGRHVYCGFIPNAAGLAAGALALGLYFSVRRQGAWPRLLALLLALLLTHALHVFVFLAVLGLILASAAWDLLEEGGRRQIHILLASAVSGFAFLPQLISFDARASSGPSFFSAIFDAVLRADRSQLPKVFWDWLFASYRYRTLDDVLQLVWLVLLLFVVGLGIRLRRSLDSPSSSRLWLMIVLSAIMFVLLPSYIGPPVKWWGGNLRLPVLIMLILIPLGASVFENRKRLLRLTITINLTICGLALLDLAHFSRTEMNGFEDVINSVPPGQKVTLLHWTPKSVHEYPGEPHGYASNYYLLLKGGFVPQNVFEHPDVPVKRKLRGAAPPWGQAEYFDWHRHGDDYDAFIVRVHRDYEHSPLHGPNQARVALVNSAGNWRYYRRRNPENLRP